MRFTPTIVLAQRMLFALPVLLAGWGSADAQVVVIGHPSVPASSLSRTDLMDYYTGDVKQWPNGAAVVVFDLKERGDARDVFYDFLGIRPSRMKSIWLKQMLAGEGDPPKAIDSEEEMIDRVARTRGAVGFVSYDKVDSRSPVKTLLVIETSSGRTGPSGTR